jgi:hypothetical protein
MAISDCGFLKCHLGMINNIIRGIMNKVYILCLGLVLSLTGFSQSCLPDGITFTTQAQIDSFQVNYPNCTEIEGDVIISGNDITNLNGLLVLSSIGGCLVIEWTSSLTSLYGLNNLTSIGGTLIIDKNTALINMVGLNNLVSVGGIIIKSNQNLNSLIGLENVTTVGEDLYISDNPITNLEALENLSFIGGDLTIQDNSSLISLTGLDNLTEIGGDLNIDENESLTSLASLSSINSIGGDLLILRNYELSSLTALNSLTSIGGELQVTSNPGITSLEGLDNIDPASITALTIYYNYHLSECAISSICSFLANPTGPVDINQNANGCGNPLEIASICGITLPCLPFGHYHLCSQAEVDNFSVNYPGCTDLGGNLSIHGNFGGNSDITNLDSLYVVTSMNGDLVINVNDMLTDLSGLENISQGSINNLGIFFNPSLSSCSIQSICAYLANPIGIIYITENATGCNSQEEIEASCGVNLDENGLMENQILIYPNPSSTQITIEAPGANSKFQISIYNPNGREVISDHVTEPQTLIDVSSLAPGLYFVRITTDRTVHVGKFVKQ